MVSIVRCKGVAIAMEEALLRGDEVLDRGIKQPFELVKGKIIAYL